MKLAKPCLIASFVLGAFTVGCTGSTTVEDTWKAPETSKLAFRRVLVIALSPSETFRHKAEDLLASKLRGTEVIKSYTVLPDRERLDDKAALDRVVAETGVDGVVMLRVVSEKTEVDYYGPSRPASYYSFNGYYGPYEPAPFYGDGYARRSRLVGVETRVYEASGGKLVWSGLTRTRDPDDSDELVEETIEAVHEELRKEKLLP